MDKFLIEGGIPLQGELTPAGNKNAALPMLAACLLTDQPVILHNVPDIADVLNMRRLLESLGVQFTSLDEHTWQVHARQVAPPTSTPTCAARFAPRSCWPAR